MFSSRHKSRTPPPPPPQTSMAPMSIVVDATSGPPETRSLSRQGSRSNDSYICNVSDDEMIERDVDLEIEARIRSTTLPTSDQDATSEIIQPQQQQRAQRQDSGVTSRSSTRRPSKSTLSQRMLSALQRNKNRGNATSADATRSKRSGSVLLGVVQGMIPENHISNNADTRDLMGADMNGLAMPDPLYDPCQDPAYMSSDDEGPAMTVPTGMGSCKDRLEARISGRRSQTKNSLSARPDSLGAAPTDMNEMPAVVYSNRRTYPAESAKKADLRLSELQDRSLEPRSRPSDERVTNGRYQNQHPHSLSAVDSLDASKSLPVAFHFQCQRAPPPAQPVDYRDRRAMQGSMHGSRRGEHGVHQPSVRELNPRRDDQYLALSASVNQIQQVVDGLENCLMASSFSSLALVALRELELLRVSTKQVRTSGTTLILAEIGHPQSQMLGPFRHLVGRAATLQNRIEMLIARVRTML